jgi:hypothetical protein
MNCVRCLSTIAPGARFCGNCGLVVAQPTAPGTGEHDPTFLKDRMVLEVVVGPGAGQRFPLGSVARLGRANGNEVQLFDAEVSRLHSVIYEYDQGYAIVDQDSINGTFVNGVRITGPTWINPGDEIRVGRSQIRVSPGPGSQAVVEYPAAEMPKKEGLSIWLIAGVLIAGGFILVAAAVFVYLLFF